MKLTTDTALDKFMDRFHMKRGLKQFDPVFTKVDKFKTEHFIDVELDSDVYYGDDDTLYVCGQRCLIYICNPSHYSCRMNGSDSRYDHNSLLPKDPKTLPKFHMARCHTIISMHAQDRGHRYVATDSKTGMFIMKYDNKVQEEKLIACCNCVQKIYHHKNVDDITPAKYFRNFPTDALSTDPLFSDNYDRVSDKKDNTKYDPNWPNISKDFKQKHNYTCHLCHKYDPTNVQTHHISAEIYNNEESNLQLLCYDCHRKQPFHGHIKKRPNLKLLFQK